MSSELDTAGLLDAMGRTGDAMIGVSGGGRVVAWNDGAERLFGYASEQALGRPCREVLDWQDLHGNVICGPGCPIDECARRQELIQSEEVLGHTSSGRALWFNVSTVVLPPRYQDQCRLVHYVREVRLPANLGAFFGRQAEPVAELQALARLTAREREVLRRLADAEDTSAVAAHLGVSTTTVRNHVQRLLQKLGVHSRTAAVALELRSRREP